MLYSKTCVKLPLSKRPKIGFQDQLSLNAGQKYCRMLQGEYSARLWTFIKLQFVIKIFVLSIFEWPIYTGFTVFLKKVLFTYSLAMVHIIIGIFINMQVQGHHPHQWAPFKGSIYEYVPT